MNVSMLKVSLLTQSQTVSNVGKNSGEFTSMLMQTMTASQMQTEAGAVETPSADGGKDAWFAIIMQRSPVRPQEIQNLPQNTLPQSDIPEITNFPSSFDFFFAGKSSATTPSDNQGSQFEGLLDRLFEILDQASQLVADLYRLFPEGESSALPGSDESQEVQGGGSSTTALAVGMTAPAATDASQQDTGTPPSGAQNSPAEELPLAA